MIYSHLLKVTPRIFGFLIVCMTWLFIARLSVVLCSFGSGEKRVQEDLVGLS